MAEVGNLKARDYSKLSFIMEDVVYMQILGVNYVFCITIVVGIFFIKYIRAN